MKKLIAEYADAVGYLELSVLDATAKLIENLC
jgi:hypothetical protein